MFFRRRTAKRLQDDRLHRAKRVLHPVFDLIEQEFARGIPTLLLTDVARNLRSTHDPAACVLDRRDRDRNIEERSVLVLTDGFKMLDPVAAADAPEYRVFLVMALFRDEREHRTADDLLGGIAEHALCGIVPALDDAI